MAGRGHHIAVMCRAIIFSVFKVDRAKYQQALITDIVDICLPAYKYNERSTSWVGP